ncbi:Aspartokinase, partial [hydrothermal vent metagenome]
MSLIVQKYGGTSVGSLDRIRAVAGAVAESKKKGHGLIIVVSAMSGETDRLIKCARELNPAPPDREMDLLMSSGERVSA